VKVILNKRTDTGVKNNGKGMRKYREGGLSVIGRNGERERRELFGVDRNVERR